MAFRRSNLWTRLAIGVVLTIGTLLAAAAQGRGGRQGPPYRPAADAKDLRAVLFHGDLGDGHAATAR
jgi:hypothetical protein